MKPSNSRCKSSDCHVNTLDESLQVLRSIHVNDPSEGLLWPSEPSVGSGKWSNKEDHVVEWEDPLNQADEMPQNFVLFISFLKDFIKAMERGRKGQT